MREKQLAQEAKKLDAKVELGPQELGAWRTGQRLRGGWSRELEPQDHPGPDAGVTGWGEGL